MQRDKTRVAKHDDAIAVALLYIAENSIYVKPAHPDVNRVNISISLSWTLNNKK